MLFFDDRKIRALSPAMTAAARLLSPRAFRDRLRPGLFFGGGATCFAFLAKVTVSKIAKLRFKLLYFFLVQRFLLAGSCFEQGHFFFENCFALDRSLMLSLPKVMSLFKPS